MEEKEVGERHSKIQRLDIEESRTFLVPNLQGLAPKIFSEWLKKVSTNAVNFVW